MKWNPRKWLARQIMSGLSDSEILEVARELGQEEAYRQVVNTQNTSASRPAYSGPPAVEPKGPKDFE